MTSEKAFMIVNNIQGWMHRNEMEWLYKVASKQVEGCTWIEVGSWKGRSLVMTALGLPKGSKLHSVESFSGSEDSQGTIVESSLPKLWLKGHLELAINLAKELRPDIKIILHDCVSIAAAKRFADGIADVVFVDAAHSEDAVNDDIKSWKPKVKQGGLICGHDVTHEGVMNAVNGNFGNKWKRGAGSIWYAR